MPEIKKRRKHDGRREGTKTEMMRVDHDFANACREISRKSGCSVAQVTRELFNSQLTHEVRKTRKGGKK